MRRAIRRRRAVASILTVCALAVGFCFAVIPGGAAAHAATTRYTSATQGAISKVGTVNPKALPRATSSRTTRQTRSKGTRALHGATVTAGHAAVQSAGATTSTSNEKGGLLENFNGVSSLDSAVTNFGLEFEPPDQGLCVGKDVVLEPVNSAYTIYRYDGSVVAGPFNVNALFNEGLTEFTSDPRCYFDKSTNTWFAIILFISSDNMHARTDIAVNASGDPTTPWTLYQLDATDDGSNGTPSHPGCPCFGDQPLLGIDGQNLYISTNEFSILGPQFNGAQIYALPKSELVDLDPTVKFVHFENLSIGDSIAASVQPAITNGDSNAEYFLSSLDPNGTGDNRVGVWAMTNRGAVAEGGVPTLSSLVIASEAYGVPPNAPQKGASSLINSGDDRMQQTQFIHGGIWGALDTSFTPEGSSTQLDAAAWFHVRPHLSHDVLSSAELVGQGYVASAGNYLLYPAIQASGNGTAAMVFTITGPSLYPSAAYATMRPGRKSFDTIHIAAMGTGPYSAQSTRWGDYSWAILDPTHDSFWMATEYMPPLSSQTPDGLQNWGTRVFEVAA